MKFGHMVRDCPDGPWSPEVTKQNATKWRQTMQADAKLNLAKAAPEELEAEVNAIGDFINSGFEDDTVHNPATGSTSSPPEDADAQEESSADSEGD